MRKIMNILSIKNVKFIGALALIFTVAVSGCANTGANNTTEPGNNTTNNSNGTNGTYIYGNANVTDINITKLEMFPVQISVIAEGYLPDGCTEINEVKTEKVGNVFNINISTKRPKDAFCTQELESFTKTIPLEVQGLKAGNYTVNVNGVTDSFKLDVDNVLNGTPNGMPPKQQVLTEADNAKSINLKVGDFFYLRLPENPSTGYNWTLNLSQGLNIVPGTDKYYPQQSSGNVEQPLVGAGGIHIWEIKANSTGSKQVTGIYKRPFEKETGEEKKFTLNVEVV